MRKSYHDVEVTLYVYQRPAPMGREPSPESLYVSTIDQRDPKSLGASALADWVLVATYTIALPNVPLLTTDAFQAAQQAQQALERQARIESLKKQLDELQSTT